MGELQTAKLCGIQVNEMITTAIVNIIMAFSADTSSLLSSFDVKRVLNASRIPAQ